MIRSRHTNAIRVNYDPDRRSFLPATPDISGPFAWWPFYREAVDVGGHVELVEDAPLSGAYALYQVVTPIGGGWDDNYFLVHHDLQGEEGPPNDVDEILRRIEEGRGRLQRRLQEAEKRACECEHVDHFEGDAHSYGQHCADVVPLRTVAGTFHVCPDCRDNHLAPFIAERTR